MVNYTVAEIRFADFSCLWVAQDKGFERLGFVFLENQFFLEFEQIYFQIALELYYISSHGLAFSCFSEC